MPLLIITSRWPSCFTVSEDRGARPGLESLKEIADEADEPPADGDRTPARRVP